MQRRNENKIGQELKMWLPAQYENVINQFVYIFTELFNCITCISIKLHQSLQLLCQSKFALPMMLKV